jgi:hypothetical protein
VPPHDKKYCSQKDRRTALALPYFDPLNCTGYVASNRKIAVPDKEITANRAVLDYCKVTSRHFLTH